MDILKSLPVPPRGLVLGQLAAPIIFMTVLELVVLTIAQLAFGGMGWILIVAVAFAVPVNFVFIAMENLLFLMFPSRTAVGVNVDLQSMGRQLLHWFLKMIVLMIIGGVVALCGWGVYAFTDSFVAACVAAWLTLVAFDGLLVLPLCGAFEDFDVASDTPP